MVGIAWVVAAGRTTAATATVDPCGMTNKRTGNSRGKPQVPSTSSGQALRLRNSQNAASYFAQDDMFVGMRGTIAMATTTAASGFNTSRWNSTALVKTWWRIRGCVLRYWW